MMTMLITALGTVTSFAALAPDELDISSCTVIGEEKGGSSTEPLKNANGEVDLTKLIDGNKEENVTIGAKYNTETGKWETLNTPAYRIIIELDGTQSFSGMRAYYRAGTYSDWNGVLDNWSAYVMFSGETAWHKLGNTWNMGQHVTPQTIAPGYNVSNVSKICFYVANVKGSCSSYLVLPEIALVCADESNNTFKSTSEITAIPAAEAAIDAIGEVTKSADCLAKIEAAEKACAAFTDEQLTRVRNYSALLAARAAYDALSSTLADDEISLKGHAVTGTDKNGKALTNSKGEVDLTKLIDGEETNITIGAEYTSSRWETYNEMSYNIDIALDGTESFSGMRVYHKANAWTNWDGVLNDWNVFVMFNGETEWKKLAYDYNRLVDKDGNKITNVPNGTIGATATLFGYNVSNVKAVRFQMLNNVTQGGIPASYIVVPEIALIGADDTKTTFTVSADISSVNPVIVNIDSLGEASLTSEFSKKLSTLEAAYAALSESQKALVINYHKLTAARDEYNSLLKAALTLTVTADSGVYSDKTGVIRFISTFNTIPVAAEIESYGTYVLNFNAFKSGEDWKESQCAVFTSEADGAPEDGESFAVDLYVPEANLSDNVAAMSFVKVKGYDYPILTYFMSGVNVLGINTDVKNLGEKSK